MGPLTLADLIGLDVVLFIMEVLRRDLGEDKYRPRAVAAQDGGRRLFGKKKRQRVLSVLIMITGDSHFKSDCHLIKMRGKVLRWGR
jgi:hypothetical protein